MKRFDKICAAAIAGLTMGAASAEANDLTYAMGYAPGSVPVIAAENMAKYSAKNGGPDIQVFPMSLLNIRETPPGIRDRIADMGFNAHGIFQAEYPNANLPAEFGVMATRATPATDPLWGPAAMSGAITEYIMLNCSDCAAEFKAEGQVYLSGQSSPAYALQCSQDVTTLADVKGKQMRTPSGYWAKWVEEMGGVSVFMSANEAFNALSQGVVDCVVIHPADLITLQLIDVVKSSTLGVPQGVFSAASVANINVDAWRELPADQRKVLLDAAAYMNAEMTYLAAQQSSEAIEEEKKRGIPVNEAAPDLQEATNAFIDGLSAEVASEYTSQYGVQDAEAKIETINKLIEKWVELTKGVSSVEDLAALYQSEIVSKIDIDTYGM